MNCLVRVRGKGQRDISVVKTFLEVILYQILYHIEGRYLSSAFGTAHPNHTV